LEQLEAFRSGLREKTVAQRREDGHKLIARCEALLDRIENQCAAMA
jgi:hypothetical protein